MTENENPLELTATTSDPRSSAEAVPALSVSEVVERYQIGNSTLRKRLAAGELVGAYKVKAGTGEAWAIPITTLDSAGIVRKPAEADDIPTSSSSSTASPAESKPVLAVLEGVVDRLTTLYEASTRQLEAAQGDRTSAQVEAADARARVEMLEAEVERERSRAEALAVELAEARVAASRKRGWFRRG